MSADVTDMLSIPSSHAASPCAVIRTPLFFQSRGEPLFGWLHRPDQAPCHDHGVIICPPIGCEQIHAHRTLRHLADAFAQAGFSVLRFDYHGTGDSAGIDENPDRHATWLANIRDAMAWLTEHTGCQQISLFGLRLGASLAAQVAAEQVVDNLLLWAPVMKGRMYVRELKALGITAEVKPQALPEAPEDIEAAGFVLTKQTADDLSKIELLNLRPQCQHALIVTRDDFAPDARLLDRWSTLGVDVVHTALPGYVGMMAEPHQTMVPQEAIDYTVGWLSGKMNAAPSAEMPLATAPSNRVLIPHQQYTCVAVGPARSVSESIFQISDQPDLFGIVSEPEGGTPEERPLIVILNSGSAYRVGPSRLSVFVARHLAAQGFRCIRLDVCGLGDSVTTEPDKENDSYAATAFRDVEIVLKQSQSRLGARRVVLMGLCSGAYVAFQSAAQIKNPALVGSVLINPLTFFWKDGMTIESSPTLQHSRSHYYWRVALHPGKWLKLLMGQTRLGFHGAVRLLLDRLCSSTSSSGRAKDDASNLRTTAEVSHPAVDDLPADLERVSNAGRHLSLFISDSDPGHRILMYYAQHKAKQMEQTGLLTTTFIQNADHTFSERVPRRTFLQSLAEHLARLYAV